MQPMDYSWTALCHILVPQDLAMASHWASCHFLCLPGGSVSGNILWRVALSYSTDYMGILLEESLWCVRHSPGEEPLPRDHGETGMQLKSLQASLDFQ
jgi:hypothetical protein